MHLDACEPLDPSQMLTAWWDLDFPALLAEMQQVFKRMRFALSVITLTISRDSGAELSILLPLLARYPRGATATVCPQPPRANPAM